MTHYGILVPANPAAPHRILTWDGNGLLDLLYRELGNELTAATVCPPSRRIPGGLRLWGQDRSLLVDDPEYNDRALAICRGAGYQVPALAGPIMFIGCPYEEDEVGLHPQVRALLDEALPEMGKVIVVAAEETGDGAQ